MPGFLFHDVIFGPVRSRRLGLSLGINLLPLHRKHCSFNCIYCECGWTPPGREEPPDLPSRDEVRFFLESRMMELVHEGYIPDALTYAGNGEPTMHPDFPGIVDDTIALRDRYMPAAKVTVLSNASRIHVPEVFGALNRLDNNIQKLDAGFPVMFGLINNPAEPVDFGRIVEGLKKFNGAVILQSMFLRGRFRGEAIDNTLIPEVDEWLRHLESIQPERVMIYPIARATPVHDLEKIGTEELEKIAARVRSLGIAADVYQ